MGTLRDRRLAELAEGCMSDAAWLSALWVRAVRGGLGEPGRDDFRATMRRMRSGLREMADMLAEPAAAEADPEGAREELREATWQN